MSTPSNIQALTQVVRSLLRGQTRAFAIGFGLSLVVLAMGVALLGVSGWFITAAAVAGLAGSGALFNVFVPSALVRMLALGRTAARYGERLSTHDATLRALSRLRIDLLRGLLERPYRQLEAVRATAYLNRVTADVDGLDGITLRLLMPGIAGLAVIALAGIALWNVVTPTVAIAVTGIYAIGPNLVFWLSQRRAGRPSRMAEAGLQALRSRLADLIAARDDLTVYGQMPHTERGVEAAQDYTHDARERLDRIEADTGFGLDLIGALALALAILLGGQAVAAGDISAAQAAVGIFAALALNETVAPVRRAVTEIGRIMQAAKRIAPTLAPAKAKGADLVTPAIHEPARAATDPAPTLRLEQVTLSAPNGQRPLFAPIDLTLHPGQTLALTGPSGSGKTSLLLCVAGQIAPAAGSLSCGAQRRVMVAQRNALMAGSVAENLRIAAPDATDATLWKALEATALAPLIESRGGLQTRLGFRGAGLSGGEARRLVLARALLCDPDLLILDEPTEGLDRETAATVLHGLRSSLPEAMILMAAHRQGEIDSADLIVPLCPPDA